MAQPTPLLFNPGCPCCAEELGLHGVPAAPDHSHRHPDSDPHERLRKQLTQCQYCWKSRGPGVTLSRCAGCKIDIYCSKECQRKAWPSHKERCKLNQRLTSGTEVQMAQYKLLREFTSKHRPTIAETGVRALDVRSDPSRASRDVLVIFLRSRSNSNRTETSFYATGADVLSPDWFGKEKAEEMREQLRQTNEAQKKAGNLGALFVVLFCLDQGMMNIAPVWFGREVFSLKPGEPWKEWMMSRLNEGIVC